MSQYNKANPFLFILDQSNDTLNTEIDNIIKRLILLCGSFSLWITSFITDILLYKSLCFKSVLDTLINIALIGFMFYYVKEAIRQNVTNTIESIRFPSDKFQYHYYNNEQMFKETISISIYIGRLKSIKLTIYIFILLYLIQIIYHLIHILIYFL